MKLLLIMIDKLLAPRNSMEFCVIFSDTLSWNVIKQYNIFVKIFVLSDSK